MIIRAEQMEAVRTAARRSFEDEMVVHLAEFSPPLFKAVKENGLREAIRLGMARAGGYGFTFRGPVRFYLELMLLFGSHFDTDPQYPWAAAILRDQEGGPQMQRAERLWEMTRDYRDTVAGQQDAYTLTALRRISDRARQPLTVPSADFASFMREEMTRAYPQKATYVGEAGLTALIGRATAPARAHGFSTPRGAALLVVLMFAFGHGCADDPLYPWIARTLTDPAITDGEDRAKRLERRAMTWLDHVLAYFDEGANA